jgi:hypothetical protein
VYGIVLETCLPVPGWEYCMFCLDNNFSTTNTALRLASCVTGYTDRQSLFVDNYSWP